MGKQLDAATALTQAATLMTWRHQKIPEATAALEKEWEKLDKIPAWQLTKVRNKNEVIGEARNAGKAVHFASLMDLCLSQEFGVGATITKNTRQIRTPR